MATNFSEIHKHQWTPQPDAEALVIEILQACLGESPRLREWEARLLQATGTRLIDWIDSFTIPETASQANRLATVGYRRSNQSNQEVWRQPEGLFPAVILHASPEWRITIHVESICDFLTAHRLDERIKIFGDPLAPLRMANVFTESAVEFWIVERHGDAEFTPRATPSGDASTVLRHQEAFRLRRRDFDREEDGFAHAMNLIHGATNELGVDRTCDLFFAAERSYWMRRNRAAQIQYSRQQQLGLGWGNHDHHTYRSSREHFWRLTAALEALGLVCRERFYAGHEAGWGAQVMEQPRTRIVVFADVDLAPDEVAGDFSHQPLPPRRKLGTVGLWCKLHGEAFLQAGMHHLECQFNFDAARIQLAEAGVSTMKPFTDFEFLRQAFTQGEQWTVESRRLEAALAEGFITRDQAEQFRNEGALGSHLEILQRDQGYKGFNQTGVSEIIQRTDPRHAGSLN